ncbi:unnamed protein product [Brassica oleracea]|uniref:(rape) hypothetical protein n=1 Tax=Brassica napus TaxID=3708 RepID=A0A816L5C4_BRANA|nr:unnamed protein product [Brassica napus]
MFRYFALYLCLDLAMKSRLGESNELVKRRGLLSS